jgi:hypothetical protein
MAGGVRTLPALLLSRLWFNSRMSSCQGDGPGAIPGGRTNFSQAVRQLAQQSLQNSVGSGRHRGGLPFECGVRIAECGMRGAMVIHDIDTNSAFRTPNLNLGAWQKSDAPALQAGTSGSVTRRPPPFSDDLRRSGAVPIAIFDSSQNVLWNFNA